MNTTSTLNNSAGNRDFGFWGGLSLARKMALAFGSLFGFAIIIAIITLVGSNRTQSAYKDALAQGVQVRNLSDHLSISLLQARRAEKNFLLRWQSEGFENAYTNYVPTFSQEVSNARKDIGQLALFGKDAATVSTGDLTQSQYNANINSLTLNLNTYVQSFNTLVDAYRKRGFDDNTGFRGQFQTAANAIEEKISGKGSIQPLEIIFLQLRQNEKDYLLQPDQQHADNVNKFITQFKNQLSSTDELTPDEKTEILTQLDVYSVAFASLVDLDKEIVIYNDNLINSARAVEPLANNIEQLGEQLAKDDITRAETNATQIFRWSIITVLIVLIVSTFLGITLSRQIAQPIIQLTTTAQKIAEGNFEAQAEIKSADEVGVLAKTFNTMTSRLQEAFEDVRRRALAVQTSAEVSRRLSVATNPNQLAIEVVEQVQAAFNYYHAHIYFLEEATGDLIMAGGTGEAGATMLARSHKVQKGRGLVGRAAATNEPVLVPNVFKEEEWLPNALLPDTKSEVAIPISSGNQVLGVLDVQQNKVDGLNEEDVSLLQSLASQIAISLQNARAFEESKAQAELESLVNSIGQKIQRATSVEDTLQTAIREIGLALGASRVTANVQATRESIKASGN